MYAPPESLAGRPHTVQGDIYALGVLLYQLAVGSSRPMASGWERDVDDELLRRYRCLRRWDPARRLNSAAELAERLIHATSDGAKVASRPSAARIRLRRRTQVRMLSTAVALLAATAAAIGYFGHEASVQRRIAVTQKSLAQEQTAKAIDQEHKTAEQKQRRMKSAPPKRQGYFASVLAQALSWSAVKFPTQNFFSTRRPIGTAWEWGYLQIPDRCLHRCLSRS